MMFEYFLFFLTTLISLRGIQPAFQACEDAVYCRGPLIHWVQTFEIFKDPKSYLDLRCVNSPEVILQNFDILMFRFYQNPTPDSVKKFLRENFGEGDELDVWIGNDYNKIPMFLDTIGNQTAKQLAQRFIEIWEKLGRKVRTTVFEHPEHYSVIAVPNGFITPGGKYREQYYWDSYWIFRGLLICDMTTTVRGMLDNFILMFAKYGYVPAGSRIYYLNRRQTPFLTILVKLYMDSTNDLYWLKKNIPYLEAELRFWLQYKTFEIKRQGKKYVLARYTNNDKVPRPDEYRHDIEACSIFDNEELTFTCYKNIKAVSEVGKHYYNRFVFDRFGNNEGNASCVNPVRVLPVDLNSILCRSFEIISTFYEAVNDRNNATFWREKHNLWLEGIREILYDVTDGIWYDFDIGHMKSRKFCWPSNFSPLWLHLFDSSVAKRYGRKAMGYFKRHNLMAYRGLSEPPDKQHDLMQMWPPLQAMIVFALWKSGDKEAEDYAREFSRRWLMRMINDKCSQLGTYLQNEDDDTGADGCGWAVGVGLDFIDTFFRCELENDKDDEGINFNHVSLPHF